MTPAQQLVETIRREAISLPTLAIDEIIEACVLVLRERQRHAAEAAAPKDFMSTKLQPKTKTHP